MTSPLTKKLGGTVVPMISPFTAEGEIDEAAVRRLVERFASHDLGLFVLGTTGEAASIPLAQRRRLVEIAIDAARERVPVFAGIGSNALGESIDAARDYLELGVEAVVAHLPSYFLLTPEEMKVYFTTLSRRIAGPLVVYNIPVATHMSIPVNTVRELADLPFVVGFKDSEATPGRLEKIAALGQRDDFAIFMGSARHSVKALRHGYDGLVPSSGNLEQALWQKLYRDAQNAEWAEAEAAQNQLDEIADIYQHDRTLGQSLAALKTLMSLDGICEPHVLLPLQTAREEERRDLESELLQLRRTTLTA